LQTGLDRQKLADELICPSGRSLDPLQQIRLRAPPVDDSFFVLKR
jgi:hypothetical protein